MRLGLAPQRQALESLVFQSRCVRLDLAAHCIFHLPRTYEHMGIKLTIRAVELAKPAEKPYEISDADMKGLLLRV